MPGLWPGAGRHLTPSLSPARFEALTLMAKGRQHSAALPPAPTLPSSSSEDLCPPVELPDCSLPCRGDNPGTAVQLSLGSFHHCIPVSKATEPHQEPSKVARSSDD